MVGCEIRWRPRFSRRADIRLYRQSQPSKEGERLGTAGEWVDRATELAMESELESIVPARTGGELSKRVGMEGKGRLFKHLALGYQRATFG